MELVSHYLLSFVHTAGWLSPLLFISIHLVRPLLFLPVILLCMFGGILFGIVAGTVYSIIGMTLSSIVFYLIIRWMPKTSKKVIQLKQKLIGQHVHVRSEEHTSELQSRGHLVCRLLLEKKNT